MRVADGVRVAVVCVTGTTTTVRVTTLGGGFGRVRWVGVGLAGAVVATVFTGGGAVGVVTVGAAGAVLAGGFG